MKLRTLPRVITLRIIGACNLRCPFCFGPRHELGPINVQALIKVVERFPEHGVEAITITGGEPLMVHELPFLLQAAKKIGLQVYLSTNGILLEKRFDDILPYIDLIGLPLDGDCLEANERMRVGSRQRFELVPNLIPLIRENYPHVIVKLGTVVTALNKEHIAGIPIIISGPRKPDFWKIYRVVYSNYGADNQDLLEISDDEFEVVAEQAIKVAKEHELPVEIFRPSYREGNYLLFEPTGLVLAATNHREVPVGNFLTNFDEVVSLWQSFVSPEQVTLANADALERLKDAVTPKKLSEMGGG